MTRSFVKNFVAGAACALLVMVACIPSFAAGWPGSSDVNVPISKGQLEQSHPSIASDGKGGMIIAWQDARNGGQFDIYMQRIDQWGALKWGVNGINICSANYDQILPKVISDSNGGAFIIWLDARDVSSVDTDLFAVHVDSTGARTAGWPANGLAVCHDKYLQHNFTAISDGQGGAYVAWEDGRQCFRWDTTRKYNNFTHKYDTTITCNANAQATANSTPRIFMQRIDADGMVWAKDGIKTCDSVHKYAQVGPQIALDDRGGVYIAWLEAHSGNTFVLEQNITGAGVLQDTITGRNICVFPSFKANLTVAKDHQGGLFLGWDDGRIQSTNGWDIYGQHLTAAKTLAWPQEGDSVCKYNQDQVATVIVADSLGNAFFVWQDHRNLDLQPTYAATDLYGQRINGTTGKPMWTAGGISLVGATHDQIAQQVLGDGENGFYLSWVDYRTAANNPNIYAMRVKSDGSMFWAGSANGIPVCSANGVQDQPTWYPTSDGFVMMWRDLRTAGDVGGDIYAQKVYTNGSLPVEIGDFTAARTGAKNTVRVAWTSVSELNTAGYEVWRQRDAGEYARIAGYADAPALTAHGTAGAGASYTILDNAASGARCAYKLVAVDNDGSKREFGPVVVEMPSPSNLTLDPNYPNPFATTSVVGFAIPQQSDVVVRVTDMIGREISRTTLPMQSAGWHSYTVDGTRLAPGTYFLAVEAAGASVRQLVSIAR